MAQQSKAPAKKEEAAGGEVYGIRVKPLEWKPTKLWNRNDYHGTEPMIIEYVSVGTFPYTLRANYQIGNSWNAWRDKSMPIKNGSCVSFEEAKAAAQADYERRILSALEATPSAARKRVALPSRISEDEAVKIAKAFNEMASGTFSLPWLQPETVLAAWQFFAAHADEILSTLEATSGAALEAQLAEAAKERDEALEELGKVILACPAGQRSMPISRTVASMRAKLSALGAQLAARTGRVKPLDEDDYEGIISAAAINMKKATSGLRGQVVTVQDSIDWWVMKETERRILSALGDTSGAAGGEVYDIRGKPLEWTPAANDAGKDGLWFVAIDAFGKRHEVIRSYHGQKGAGWTYGDTWYRNLDEAKEAAVNAVRVRILSALEVTPAVTEAWQVKDHADGWIDFATAEEALAEVRVRGGALIRPAPTAALEGGKVE